MKPFLTMKRVAAITGALLMTIFLSVAISGQAAFLQWGSTPVKTSSVASCFTFAETAMRGLSFQNIRRSQAEATGSLGGTHAAITCVGTTPRATAVVMVVGDNGPETAHVRDSLRSKIAGIVRFD